jgi:hypothetical protein
MLLVKLRSTALFNTITLEEPPLLVIFITVLISEAKFYFSLEMSKLLVKTLNLGEVKSLLDS